MKRIPESLNITRVELIAMICLQFIYYSSEILQPVFLTNAIRQTTLFVFVVQIPLLITGRMSFVDIGWPFGLILLSYNCYTLGNGWFYRRLVFSLCLALHGKRMGFGAIVLLSTIHRGEELSRYKYAKERWLKIEKMPEWSWPLKAQQETFMQCVANMVVLATPFLCACMNKNPKFHYLEYFGIAGWILSWVIENIADGQKLHFLMECKQIVKKDITRKQEIKSAVLGYPPFNTKKYYLWTISRHPNYFGELCCWISFAIAGIPSVMALQEEEKSANNLLVISACYLGIYFCPRLFYGCLVYWTGAAPAEHGSLKHRPNYRNYQEITPVLFPTLGIISEHKTRGWPDCEIEKPIIKKDD